MCWYYHLCHQRRISNRTLKQQPLSSCRIIRFLLNFDEKPLLLLFSRNKSKYNRTMAKRVRSAYITKIWVGVYHQCLLLYLDVQFHFYRFEQSSKLIEITKASPALNQRLLKKAFWAN